MQKLENLLTISRRLKLLLSHIVSLWNQCFKKPRKLYEGLRTAKRGAWAEEQAAHYLKAKGYSILLKNWRSGHEEIDLICLFKKCLVFVEVRGRDEKALVQAYASLNKRKKEALKRASNAYLRQLKERPNCFRWDLVQLSWESGKQNPTIYHYEAIQL